VGTFGYNQVICAGCVVDESRNEITNLLQQWREEDKAAEPELFELLMPDLRRLAGHYFRCERQGHTLQPTALVNEAFLRLAAAKGVEFHDRGHFLAIRGQNHAALPD
jgi:hypothetical protein